jgi:hypothetical protein
MAPSSERRLSRPSVEARVQLDRVELLCVAAEPVCGCQRGLVQDGVPVVVAPSRGPDPDLTHCSSITAFCPPSHAGAGLSTSTSSPFQLITLRSRPASLSETNTPRSRLPPRRRRRPNRLNARPVRARERAEYSRRARRSAC